MRKGGRRRQEGGGRWKKGEGERGGRVEKRGKKKKEENTPAPTTLAKDTTELELPGKKHDIVEFLHYCRLFGTNNAEDTIEFELPGKKYDDMVEFLCCVYPDVLNPITGILLRTKTFALLFIKDKL